MMTPINYKTVELLINRYGYYFYIVKCVPGTQCKCVNHTTKAPDPTCKKCLGTGRKIKIQRVFGTIREIKERESDASTFTVSSTPKIIYLKGNHIIHKDDLVIDSEDVYHVLACQHHRGERGEFAFTRLVCPYVKSNIKHLLVNFKELLREHKLRKKKK